MPRLLAGAALLAAALASPPGRAEAPPPREAWLFKIPLPLDAAAVTRVQQALQATLARTKGDPAPPILVFEFVAAKDHQEHAAASGLHDAARLADILSGKNAELGLADVKTVAFLPQSVAGHVLLAALACKQVVIAPEAEFGPANADARHVDEPMRAHYREMALRRKTFSPAVALKLIDPAIELREAQGERGEAIFATPAEIRELKETQTIAQDKLFGEVGERGKPGRFSAEEARRVGLAALVARDRLELAAALRLPAESLREELLAAPRDPVLIDLSGPIDAEKARVARGLLQKAVQRGSNFICLKIDSSGGAPDDSLTLANDLAAFSAGEVRTVAYVPGRATNDAALIALACDDVVLGPEAELGGESSVRLAEADLEAVKSSLRAMLAQKKGRSWSLAAAMLDPRLEVFKCTREGVVEHFCDEELQERNKNVAGAAWKRVEPLERVSRPGRPLAVKGAEAVEYRLARRTAANFNDFKAGYGLELDPRLMEEGWADTLIKALANPLVTFFLLVIGGVAIYIELHAPGIGVGAFVATVCFVLFFWSHALAGSAGWLEVLLFVTGVVCILLEIFVLPGFGIFGLGGGLLVLASLVLASQTFVGLPKTPSEVAAFQRSLITVGGAAIAVMATIVLINRWLPRAPMLGHIVLEPPSREEAAEIARSESLTHFEDLLGVEGTATTPLVPGGKVRLQGQILDAVTDGDFVNRGQRIVVTEVHGNRIVVRAVEE